MSITDDFQSAPVWQKILLGLLGVVLAWGFVKQTWIKDKPRQIRTLQRNIRMMEKDFVNQKAAADDYEIVLKEYAQWQSKIADHLPSLKRALSTVSELLAEAESRSVAFTLVEPGTLRDELAYWILPIALEFQGPLPSVTAFLRSIEISLPTSKADFFSLSQKGDRLYGIRLNLAILASKEAGGGEAALGPVSIPVIPETSTSPKPPQKTVVKPRSSQATLVLRGFWTGTRQGALINDRFVRLGESIQTYRVTQVDPSGGKVVLKRGAVTKILRLSQ
jgi:Tfp pilus assembly protein PilO